MALENALPWLSKSPETAQKHTLFLHGFQKLRRLCNSMTLLLDFWRVQRLYESTLQSCLASTVSENCRRMGRAFENSC